MLSQQAPPPGTHHPTSPGHQRSQHLMLNHARGVMIPSALASFPSTSQPPSLEPGFSEPLCKLRSRYLDRASCLSPSPQQRLGGASNFQFPAFRVPNFGLLPPPVLCRAHPIELSRWPEEADRSPGKLLTLITGSLFYELSPRLNAMDQSPSGRLSSGQRTEEAQVISLLTKYSNPTESSSLLLYVDMGLSSRFQK